MSANGFTRSVRAGVKRLVHAVRARAGGSSPAASSPAHPLAGDLERLFPDGAATVFDVGAYVGEFAVLTHRAFPTARVWCFEPFPASYERIRARFSAADWVQVHNFGLSDRDGRAELIIGADQSTNSIVSPVITNGAFASGLPRTTITLKTLSACAQEFLGRDPQLSILKVDTEGNDLAVLKGGEELLRATSIEAIHVEVMFLEHFKGAAGFLEIAQYLQQFGYRLFSLYDLKRNPQGQLRYGNALFLSPHRQEFAGIAR